MEKSKIIQAMEIAGIERIVDRGGWIMGSCPFAESRHSKGSDRRPSFGISVTSPSYYHCFACGSKGQLRTLPSSLTFEYGKNYSELQRFIATHENLIKKDYEDYDVLIKKPSNLPSLLESTLDCFCEIPEQIFNIVKLNKLVATALELKWDSKRKNIVIPVRDEFRRLVCIRGRGVFSKSFYVYEGRKAKSFGIWYGMQSNLQKDNYLVIVEGERDYWALYQSGVFGGNIWSAMGLPVTKSQLYQLKQVVNPILLFLDNDKAGVESTKILIKELWRDSLYLVTNYYGKKDPQELVENGLLLKALKSIKKIKFSLDKRTIDSL
jgi:DNA primase